MIFWQFILKGLDELSIVGNQILSLEMLITRLIHLKDMPSYETIVNTLSNNNLNATEENIFVSQDKKIDLKEKNKINEKAKEQIKNTLQTKPELVTSNNADLSQKTIPNTISSFESLIKVSSEKKEIELKYDLVNNVNLIRFSQGKIDISFNENLSKNFVRSLSEKLLEWTGKRWVITLTKEAGQKTFSEIESIKKKEILEKGKNEEIYKKFKNIFSDGELIKVSKKD